MDKEFYDKYSKDLECACCQDLGHCINRKEPLKINCAVHYFKDKIVELETKLEETEELNKKLAEHSQSVDKALDDSCDVIRTLKQQLVEKEKSVISILEKANAKEKDKEETKRMEDFERSCQEYYKSNQTAIVELEKTKENMNNLYREHKPIYFDLLLIRNTIDQQIKLLKGENL